MTTVARASTACLLLAALAAGCGKKPEPAAPTPDAPATDTADDLKAIQGGWRLVSYQNPDPKGYRPEELDQLKEATFTFDGPLLKVGGPKGQSETFAVRLDTGKSPRAFDLIPADANGQPRKRKFVVSGGTPQEEEEPPSKGIYTLRGDQLTVAVSSTTEYRPTEFKAAAVENTGPFVTANKRGRSLVFVAELERAKK